jgi:hypothetical protein
VSNVALDVQYVVGTVIVLLGASFIGSYLARGSVVVKATREGETDEQARRRMMRITLIVCWSVGGLTCLAAILLTGI